MFVPLSDSHVRGGIRSHPVLDIQRGIKARRQPHQGSVACPYRQMHGHVAAGIPPRHESSVS